MNRIELVRRLINEQLDDVYSLLAIPRCIHNHIRLFRRLGEVLQIARSDNTFRFPDPGRRALMRIIWPEGSP